MYGKKVVNTILTQSGMDGLNTDILEYYANTQQNLSQVSAKDVIAIIPESFKIPIGNYKEIPVLAM